MMRITCAWTTALLASVLLGACAEDPFVVETVETAEPPVAFVSDPVSLVASAAVAASGVEVVYVSLPPGTAPSGSERVEVLNTANDAEESIPITGGGFDPVPIPAVPGDTLRFRAFAGALGDELERPIVLTQWETVVPLSSPPDIVRTYPRGGKPDVPVALSILVVFSEPLDSLSLGAGSVELLRDGVGVPADLGLSPDGLRVVLAPAAPLAPDTEYELRIAARIEDLDGDTFGREELIRFSTGTPGSQTVLAPTDLCSDHPPTSIPTFVDANLEGAIRTTLGFSPQDVLTCEVVADLTSLSYNHESYRTSPPPQTVVQSLEGIQNLTGLTRLVLSNHALKDIGPLASLTGLDTLSLSGVNWTPPMISDIGPLAALTGLNYLNLGNNGAISDLTPLSGLAGLVHLHIRHNSIVDLTPLSGMSSLRRVNLSGNAIVDIRPLTALRNLEWLAIADNSIRDIAPLSGMTSIAGNLWLMGNGIKDLRPIAGMSGIEWLFARDNDLTNLEGIESLASATQFVLDDNPNLSDIAPLLANPDLSGDRIHLANTSVSCVDVQRLEERGALVSHTCLLPPVFLSPRPLAQGTVGVSYFEVLTATGGTGVYTWSGGTWVDVGVTVSQAGVISGVPTTPGRYLLPASVQSGGARAGAMFSLVIAAP